MARVQPLRALGPLCRGYFFPQKASPRISAIRKQSLVITNRHEKPLMKRESSDTIPLNVDLLHVNCVDPIPSILNKLASDPSRAAQIRAIRVSQVQPGSEGRCFRWVGFDESATRKDTGKRYIPIWTSSFKTDPALHIQDFQFHSGELTQLRTPLRLQQSISALRPCPAFHAVGHKARIDATMSHGDSVSLLDDLLRTCPAVEHLVLQMPSCPYEGSPLQALADCPREGCGRDITWDYAFPGLRNLTLEHFDSRPKALASFLHRHPSIEILTLNIDCVDPALEALALASNSLPNLRSLSFHGQGESALVSSFFSGLKSSSLVHLRVEGFPHSSYSNLTSVAGTVRCLELDLRSPWRERYDAANDDWEGQRQPVRSDLPPLPQIIKDILPQLYRLQELALDVETRNVYFDDGREDCSRHPDRMDENDLKLALQLLLPASPIRALRMSDSRGKRLPPKFLEDLPSVPPGLEYLKWDAEEFALYRLEWEGGRVRAVECELVREVGDPELWYERRVLDFE